MVLLENLRKRMKEEGITKLPAFSFPGGYPIYYAMDNDNNDTVCAECATKDIDHVEAYGNHMEGTPIYCDRCGAEIESAYGDPEEQE